MGIWRRVFGRKEIFSELSEEMRAHLDEKLEELVKEGMSRKEAEQAARREFGNLGSTECAGCGRIWDLRWWRC
jgi:putative ABC transport system permease protein